MEAVSNQENSRFGVCFGHYYNQRNVQHRLWMSQVSPIVPLSHWTPDTIREISGTEGSRAKCSTASESAHEIVLKTSRKCSFCNFQKFSFSQEFRFSFSFPGFLISFLSRYLRTGSSCSERENGSGVSASSRLREEGGAFAQATKAFVVRSGPCSSTVY